MALETSGPEIEAVRTRRADLHEILIDLEHAIAAAVPGRESAWTEQVRATMERLGPSFADHVTATEGPDGLFDRVRRRSPRLDHQCRKLAAEHGTITTEFSAACAALEQDPDAARTAILDLLASLARHRQRGADLVYEAYAVDLGGSD